MKRSKLLEEFAEEFPDATPEQLEEMAEVIRKFENPTPEERQKMQEDENRINAALRRAYEGGGEEEKLAPPFECRICGSTEYTPLPAKNGRLGPGGRGWITGYECKGCSVTFSDLVKFSSRK